MLPIAAETSDTAFASGFQDPVKSAYDLQQDWERAGVALNDASQGLMVKVWTATLTVDPDTDVGTITVDAPGVSPTVLFSGVGITEIALAFDQNMNPVVAYMQDGAAKFWWYDTLAAAMVHTTLPAGSKDPRVTMDEKRLFNIAESDVLLSYLRGGNLYVRYQRDRYLTEYLLKSVGADAVLISMAQNRGFRIQWHLRFAEVLDGSAQVQAEPLLADVLMSLSRRSGLAATKVNVSHPRLWEQTVPGYLIETDDGIDKRIDALRDMYFFDKASVDRQLKFVPRGGEVVARIPYVQLVEGNPQSLQKTIVQEAMLPREVNIRHLDPTAGFAENKQFAQRRSNMVKAKTVRTLSAAMVLTPDQAASAALTKLKIEWYEQRSYKFSTTIQWSELTVTDVVEVEDELGEWHRMRLEERNEDGGIIEWKGKQDAGSYVYNQSATGGVLPPPTSTTPGLVGETRIEVLNIPVQRDEDDELGVYIAAAGDSEAWRGYTMLISADNEASYFEAYTADAPSTLGDTLTALLAEGSYQYQDSQTVDVEVNFPLESITEAQLYQNQNRCVIGDEVLQFQNAVLLGMNGDKYQYRLSNLIRARYTTTPAAWPVDTRFVLIDQTLVFVRAQVWMLGTEMHYKPVSFGLTEDETIATAYDFDVGVSQTEWPPYDVRATRVGSDVTVTWIGVARLGMDSTPYHSKYTTGYRVKFSDGHTIDTALNVTTATYNSVFIGTTVQVAAINQITGVGLYSAAIAT